VSPAGLLLALGLGIGVMAQSCDVGGFTIDDVSDHVTVTNASSGQSALVLVSTSLNRGQLVLTPGQSRSFTVLAATKYAVEVAPLSAPSGTSYAASLIELKARLEDLAKSPGAGPADIANAVTDLWLVDAALKQMNPIGMQSCSHSLTSGVDGQATLSWTEATGGIGLWVLNCG
jgi:hypothetical protein